MNLKTKTYVYPSPRGDVFWNREMESVMPWTNGLGLDVGSGGRTLRQDIVCLDLFDYGIVDVVGDGACTPFADSVFDFVLSCHNFEHFADPVAALREWSRIVVPGGHLCLVVPDTEFTRGNNSDATPHCNEWTHRVFMEPVPPEEIPEGVTRFSGVPDRVSDFLEVVSDGPAQPGWSFHCVSKVL